MSINLTRERNRRCENCSFEGETIYVRFAGKTYRACNVCLVEVERLRFKLQCDGLDSVETRR